MYILVNKSRMLLGVFTTKETLNMAIKVLKDKEPGCLLYYQEFEPDTFSSVLIPFWTLHSEYLIEIDREANNI